jgi:ABC-type cobalamin/Fe3+-siderophores transport system ATPase subunit
LITQLRLRNYKGFESFNLPFRSTTVLVGPNNAGKSTAIGALRASNAMLRLASRTNAPLLREDRGEQYRAWPLDLTSFGIDEENLRHEFRQEDETRLELRARSGVALRAVWPGGWPEEDTESPFFYLTGPGGLRLSMPRQVRSNFPSVATIPVLAPVDAHENVLTSDYVRKNRSGRLASRHFRNQLALLSGKPSYTHTDALDEFIDFARIWLSELGLERPTQRQGERALEYDVYYKEGRTPKELAWCGDGVQVFLQLLLHLFNLRGTDTIVLDEPDVYLHADLQRRLIRLLDGFEAQIIMSTHSPEIVVEAPPDAVVWVDRGRPDGVLAPDPSLLAGLSGAMGTQFNLKLARVLRARLALFVEGDDLDYLANLAKTVGATALVTEEGLAVVPLGGVSNWQRLEGFSWLVEKLLQEAVTGAVILDRDYHSKEAVRGVVDQLKRAGLEPHIWKRKELESYLLSPQAISRLARAPLPTVELILAEESEALRAFVHSRMTTQRFEERAERRIDLNRVSDECGIELSQVWSDMNKRIELCPPKRLLSSVNRRLQSEGHKAVSFEALSRHLRPEEIPDEMVRVLLRVDELSRGEV